MNFSRLNRKMQKIMSLFKKKKQKVVNVKENTEKFLAALQTACVENHTMFLYWYAKTMLEYYSRCHVTDRTQVTIEFDIQMTDYGDELFNTVYTAGRQLFGPSYSVNDNMQMKIVSTDNQSHWSSKDIFNHTGSTNGEMLHFVWNINLAKIDR